MRIRISGLCHHSRECTNSKSVVCYSSEKGSMYHVVGPDNVLVPGVTRSRNASHSMPTTTTTSCIESMSAACTLVHKARQWLLCVSCVGCVCFHFGRPCAVLVQHAKGQSLLRSIEPGHRSALLVAHVKNH